MPSPHDFDFDNAPDLSDRCKRELEISKNAGLQQRLEIAKKRSNRFFNTPVLPGDRSGNLAAKNTKKKYPHRNMELAQLPWLVQPGGKYWYKDVPMTLAVITHARMIMASNKKSTFERKSM
jgi:hypothetical protein